MVMCAVCALRTEIPSRQLEEDDLSSFEILHLDPFPLEALALLNCK